MRTQIDGKFVVGYDEDTDSHEIIRDGTVVTKDDEILHVGDGYDGSVDRTIDGKFLVVPGLINMHAHVNPAIGPFWYDRQRGSDWRRPKEWIVDPDEPEAFSPGDMEDWAIHAMATMLKTGSTTFADLTAYVCHRWDDTVYEPRIYAQAAGELGLRAYVSHRFRTGVTYTDDDGETAWVWDEKRGHQGLDRALQFYDERHGTCNDRIRTMLFPYTLDTVSEDLLRRTKEEADERDIHVRMHTAQSQSEIRLIDERHGMTPIDYLDEIGYLDDNVCLTHCKYPDGTEKTDSETLERIGESGATVISCPIVYRRRGGMLNSFTRYREHGINMALGTDTFPQNIVEEMRWGALGTKLITEDPAAGTAREMFDAVTLGGAQALSRSDIGRLTEGAKADVAVFDMSGSHVSPTHDPIKALVHYVTPADTAHIFIDGNHLVQDGEIPGLDVGSVLEGAQRTHDKMKQVFADWKGEPDLDAAFPSSYPVDPEFEAYQ